MNVYRDIYAGVFLSILGVIIIVLSLSFKQLTKMSIGPRFFPQLIGMFLLLINVYFIFVNLKILKSMNNKKIDNNFYAEKQEFAQNQKTKKEQNIANVILTIVLLISTTISLEYTGFIISSCLYLFFQFIILAPNGKKNYMLFATISIISTILVYFFFTNGFNLVLPRGRIW